MGASRRYVLEVVVHTIWMTKRKILMAIMVINTSLHMSMKDGDD